MLRMRMNGQDGRHPAWGFLVGSTLIRAFLVTLLLLTALVSNTPPLLAQTGEPRAGQQVQVSDYLQNQLRTTDGPVSMLVVLRDQVAADAVLARANLRSADPRRVQGCVNRRHGVR